MYTVSILGAGNVADHISRHLYFRGCRIQHIWSRSPDRAQNLAADLDAAALWGNDHLPEGADFYIMAVSDSGIEKLAARHSGMQGIWLHTAGAVDMQVLAGHFKDYGVLYPLQTLTAGKSLDLSTVPLLLEASSPLVMEKLSAFAGLLSGHSSMADSPKRLAIHLAAVFANNFSNHMVHIASRLLEEQGEELELLIPLLRETFEKIVEKGPKASQTGPALRSDQASMDLHRTLLEDHPLWDKLYTFVSRSIQDEQL